MSTSKLWGEINSERKQIHNVIKNSVTIGRARYVPALRVSETEERQVLCTKDRIDGWR